MHTNANGCSVRPRRTSNGYKNNITQCSNRLEIYMEQSEGFEVKWNTDKKPVCLLNKFLYSLKQSGRNWNKTLHDCFSWIDFVQNQADHSVYTRHDKERIIIITWVDDLILVVSLNNIRWMLASDFETKNFRKRHFRGTAFNITQEIYATKIQEKFDTSDCKTRTTACEQKLNFINSKIDGLADPRKYRGVISSLICLMTCTRPVLSYIVGEISQYLSEPHE